MITTHTILIVLGVILGIGILIRFAAELAAVAIIALAGYAMFHWYVLPWWQMLH